VFFDFHTHNTQIGKAGIYNYRIGKDQKIPKDVEYFTAGIHPWDVKDVDLDPSYKELKKLIATEKCLGIGEIGLDKHFGTNLDLQLQVFRNQLELAKQSTKKVLIIHCVKAYQEIIQEKKSSNDDLKWVLHGFNGSEELIRSLIRFGFYFSIGDMLFHPKSKISRFFHQIPSERLFLETDESKYSIEKIYQEAANKRQTNLELLRKTIEKNLQNLFPSLNG